MFKKTLIALAALGLSAPAAAEAKPQVSFELRLGTPGYNSPQHYNRYFDNRRQFRYYPRCDRREVAVRHPHYRGRYICVERRIYDRYDRQYRWDRRR